VEYNNVTQFSPWAITSNAPTAAPVSISGRVLTAAGRGIRNAALTLTAADGSIRSTRSNTFGYYRFDSVVAGETYVVGVAAKGYTFAQPTRVVAVFDQITDLDFTAEAFP
jgi:hypothetical protein